MKDKQGREYARMDQLKLGDIVEVDSDFTCMRPGPAPVLKGPLGLYVKCDAGSHYLDGQLADDNLHLIGIYKL